MLEFLYVRFNRSFTSQRATLAWRAQMRKRELKNQ